MTCRSKFFPYLQRRPGRRDTVLQSFELRFKAKDKIRHEDMFGRMCVEVYTNAVVGSDPATILTFCFL